MTPFENTGLFPLAAGAQLRLQTSGATPPVSSYVTQNQTLSIQAWNSGLDVTLKVTMLLLLPDGTTSLNMWNLLLTTDRQKNTLNVPLTEGFLLYFAVYGATVPYGNRTFAACKINTSSGNSTITIQELVAGYINKGNFLSWPGNVAMNMADGPGALISITGTTPAAAAEISETVPSGAIWRIKSFWFKLTTSAVVNARIPHVIIDDGVNVLLDLPASSSQVAAQTITYLLADGVASSNGVDGVLEIKMPFDLRLMAGYRIRTLTTSLSAGDQYTAPQYLVTEWLFG